ncbi:DUF669 domain-containing protein [Thalassoglobus polymorphus]|uniref:DUF669 domain-containing protein n=1 Tax=Thalassoglobus polymorphus TaxID=2527994 RepID=A0A517QH16_9PLAN|nr:DUF669 domain-containing protein [Thalassoglobus polymorphus]QDT30905.1 hypothetical protein Mal48_01340 [Thalassoglobus polymorphus]QDT30950.1 hypothetical protein Mal48_01790 [Thalassoglobus polymorphus]
MAAIDWNHDDYQESRGGGQLYPAGDYLVKIVKEEKRETKTKNGDLLALELSIGDGEHRGGVLFWSLNLWHNSTRTRDIARGELKGICNAINKPTLRDTSELCEIPFILTLGLKGTGDDMRQTFQRCQPRNNRPQPPPQQPVQQPSQQYTQQPPQQPVQQPAGPQSQPEPGPGAPVW